MNIRTDCKRRIYAVWPQHANIDFLLIIRAKLSIKRDHNLIFKILFIFREKIQNNLQFSYSPLYFYRENSRSCFQQSTESCELCLVMELLDIVLIKGYCCIMLLLPMTSLLTLVLFSRVHATLYVTMSVGRSVRPSVRPKSLRFFRCLELKGDQI